VTSTVPPVDEFETEPPGATPPTALVESAGSDTVARAGGRWLVPGAALLYLGLAVVLWWSVWSNHPTATTTCGCGDAARFLWFFAWPSFALGHGHGLFYSQYLFHPTGINLLNDTSVLGLTLPLVPLTRLFGPVLSMNVALTLTPVLSALSMLALLRRWVRWAPAAVIGGLLYGFSPFVITELAYNQLNIAFLAVPPLVVLALDDLLIRQRRSPIRTGLWLAVLLIFQFFVSTEVLLITVVAGVMGLALLVLWAAVRRPEALRSFAPSAAKGAGVAAGATVVLLAWPTWYLLHGPGHLSGPIWSNGSIDQYGNSLTTFWGRGGGLATLVAAMLHFGGYQGPGLPTLGYLGIGAVVLALVGLVVWRHDRRLQLFGAVALVAGVLSLGPGHGYWVPWEIVKRVPWVGDIVEIRFTLVLTLCLSVMGAVTLDRLVRWAGDRWPSDLRRRTVIGVGVGVVALLPGVVALWPNLPLTARAVVVPEWYRTAGTRLPPGQVLLAYPAPFSGIQAPMAWQAVGGMQWEMAGGGGPEGVASRAGSVRAGFTVLADASLPLGPAPEPTSVNLAAVRHALAAWQVTMVVIPDQSTLPTYDQGRATAYAVGLFTAALGEAPTYQHSAWVWSSIPTDGPSLVVVPTRFAACTASSDGPSRLAVADCVLAAGAAP